MAKIIPPVSIEKASARNNIKVLLAQARVARGLVIRDAPKKSIVKKLDGVIEAIEYRISRRKNRKK